jgi:hypothetical protein
MRSWLCDVIGCSEVVAWARAARVDDSPENFLCNACWHALRANHPERTTYYTVCNADLATLPIQP